MHDEELHRKAHELGLDSNSAGNIIAVRGCAECDDLIRKGFLKDWEVPTVEILPEKPRGLAVLDDRMKEQFGMTMGELMGQLAGQLEPLMSALNAPSPIVVEKLNEIVARLATLDINVRAVYALLEMHVRNPKGVARIREVERGTT